MRGGWRLTGVLLVLSHAATARAGSNASAQLVVRPHAAMRQAALAALAGEPTTTVGDVAALDVTVIEPVPGHRDAVQRRLRSSGLFRFVEPNGVAHATSTPNDPLFGQQWALPLTQVPNAWLIADGHGSVVAIVDTGIDATHPDLAGQLVPGENVLDPGAAPDDDNGHGTHMAGIVAAAGDNNLGVIGVAPGAQLMPVKVMDASGTGTYTDIANGIVFATDHGANVINLSLGSAFPSALLSDAVNYAAAHGVSVIAAAGNSGSSAPNYPAAYAGVIAVGATDATDAHPAFSSFGTWLGLVAPGVQITTTDLSGGYADSYGTSPAAAFASGAAALVRAANPNLSPGAVQSVLTLTSDDLGAPGFDPTFGWGRINAARAVEQAVAMGTGGTPPSVALAAPLDGSVVDGSVPLAVDVGAAELARVEYAVDGMVIATSVSPPFDAAWDTTLAAVGPHVLTATAYDAIGQRATAAPVTASVAGAQATCGTPGVICLAGGGSARTDCFSQWLVVSDPTLKIRGGRAAVLTCRDGAPCDRDGQADGACTFDLALCFAGAATPPTGTCQPTELATVRLLSPTLAQQRMPGNAEIATTILNAVAAVGGGGMQGVCRTGLTEVACQSSSDCDSAPGAGDGQCAFQQASLTGVVGDSDQCTALQAVRVPLRTTRFGWKSASRSLKLAAVPVPGSAGTDTDKLGLVCLPAD